MVFATTALPQQPPPSPAPAETKPAAAQPAVQAPLKIVVLQGEGAKNNIRTKTAVAPVVEVRDEADKPVANAEVVFQLPSTGASGSFNGWMRTQTVRTNAQGQATVNGYAPNDEEGRFNIKVTATSRTGAGNGIIAQANVRGAGASAAGGKRSGWWKVAAIAGAGALGGGIYLATRGGSSSSVAATNPVVITTGPITVAGPR